MIQAPTTPVDWLCHRHIGGAVAVEVADAGDLPHRGIGRAEARPAGGRAVLDDPGADESRWTWFCHNTSEVLVAVEVADAGHPPHRGVGVA